MPGPFEATYPFLKLLLSFLRLNPLRSDGETRTSTEQVAKEVFHGSLVDKQLRERSRVTEPRYIPKLFVGSAPEGFRRFHLRSAGQ